MNAIAAVTRPSRLAVALVAGLALAGAVGVGPAAAQSSTAAGLPAPGAVHPALSRADLVLAPGDLVRIVVWQKPELTGEFAVLADGSVADPFYRDVYVGGIPFDAAAERVREYIARFETTPRVLVEPLFRVGVGGEVQQPNLYSLRPETTVLQAVMLAGGASERGRLERVRLVRGGSEVVGDLTATGSELARTPVRSGDQIIVGRRGNVFRDFIAPAASVTGAIAAVLNIVLN